MTKPLRSALLPLSVGASVTVALYLSLLLLHPGSLHSWGHLQTIGDVWAHFLRRDFGTFQISGHEESHFSWAPLAIFAAMLLRANPGALLLALMAFYVARSDRRLFVVLCCFLLSVFGLLPFATFGNDLALERFFLMPTALCVIIAAAVWSRVALSSRLANATILIGLITASLANMLPRLPDLIYAHDMLIEDYAQNLLRMVQDRKRPVILVDADTRFFALRYVQIAQRLSPQAIVISAGSAFEPTQLDKISRLAPDFKVGRDWDQGPNARSLIEHMIRPNLSRFDFLTSARLNEPAMQTVFVGLGRRLPPGAGSDSVDVETLPLIRRRTTIDETPSLEPSEKRSLYAEYAFAYLKLGMKAQNAPEQLMYFNQALAIVPYCWPALANICVINEKLSGHVDTDCRARLTQLKATNFNYY